MVFPGKQVYFTFSARWGLTLIFNYPDFKQKNSSEIEEVLSVCYSLARYLCLKNKGGKLHVNAKSDISKLTAG